MCEDNSHRPMNILKPKSCANLKAICILASCPWGPVTANGVDLLTKTNVIYIKPRGLTAVAGGGRTAGRTERTESQEIYKE